MTRGAWLKGHSVLKKLGKSLVDWGKGKSTTYEEKDFKVKVKN